MSVSDLIMRPATTADADAVTALVRSAYRGEDSRAGWTTEADLLDDQRIDVAGVAAKIDAADGVVLLASSGASSGGASSGGGEATGSDGSDATGGDGLVGCCEVARRGGQRAYFGMFAVRPAAQSGGIGRRMLAEAERYARDHWGTTVMEMTVIAQRDTLIDWYLRRGYARTGETRPFPYEELVGGTALRDDLYFVVLAKDLV